MGGIPTICPKTADTLPTAFLTMSPLSQACELFLHAGSVLCTASPMESTGYYELTVKGFVTASHCQVIDARF